MFISSAACSFKLEPSWFRRVHRSASYGELCARVRRGASVGSGYAHGFAWFAVSALPSSRLLAHGIGVAGGGEAPLAIAGPSSVCRWLHLGNGARKVPHLTLAGVCSTMLALGHTPRPIASFVGRSLALFASSHIPRSQHPPPASWLHYSSHLMSVAFAGLHGGIY